MLKYVLQGLKYRAGTEGERVCLVSEKKKKDHMLEVEDTDYCVQDQTSDLQLPVKHVGWTKVRNYNPESWPLKKHAL